MRKAPLNRVKFRLDRAAEAWCGLVEIVRQASSAPGYCGPSLEAVETIERAVAEVRGAVQDWTRAAARQRLAARRRAVAPAAAGRVSAELQPR